MSAIVCYFSATGRTKKEAEKIAASLNADLFEIKPETEYTKHDLNWMNKNSRSTIEMYDINCRPQFIKADIDFNKYDDIYLGFPIWWYVAPRIINSFLEYYNFKNKTIKLFATSGGSDFGKTADALKISAQDCNFIKYRINGKLI